MLPSAQGGWTTEEGGGQPSVKPFLPAIWVSKPAETVCLKTKASLFLCWT